MKSVPTKIMLIDDEPKVRLVVQRFLTGAGFTVVECADGIEALERMTIENPALVVLDVDMPRMNGWETLRELRRRNLRIPVLMLTNVQHVAARIHGLEAGADDYLGKPCDLQELQARIRALLRRSGTNVEAGRRLRINDLEIDLGRKTARRGTTPVKLTRLEFSLLEFLSRQPGAHFSRDAILKEVWGITKVVNSHAIDTHLWRLRRKLGDVGEQARWLRNQSGVGYALECEVIAAADNSGAPP